jgi:cell division protein ZipA
MEQDEGSIVVMPASVGAARVETAGLDRASEDMTSLLTPPRARANQEHPFEEEPSSSYHYLVDLELPRPTSEEKVLAAFSQQWFASRGFPEFYGRKKTGPWATPRSRQNKGPYEQLVLGIALFQRQRREPVASHALLEDQLNAIQVPAKQLGITKIVPRETTEAATGRARKLGDIIERCYLTASIVVRAPRRRPFKGREIWDVMNSMGLEWGALDLFHWNVPHVGEDLFRVWTTTAPQYFLPEAAAKGATYEDIVFEFEVPKRDSPLKLLGEMLKAAEYAQRRLGGTLVDHELNRFNEQKLRDAVEASVRCLHQAGHEPGAPATLELFYL